MRVFALTICFVALLALPTLAQSPTLTLAGNGHYGTTIGVEISNASPDALGIAVIGLKKGPFPIGNLVTLGIQGGIFDALGVVSEAGSVGKIYPVPVLPPMLTGTPLYVQGVTVAATPADTGELLVKTTTVWSVLLNDVLDG